MFAHLAQEPQKAEVLEPVVVVDHQRAGGGIIKDQKFLQLCPNAGLIGAQRRLVQQVALGRLAAWVANHARRAAYQRHWAVAGALQVHEQHNRGQVADV